MTPDILFAAPALWPDYRDALPQALSEAGVTARIVTETTTPETIDYIVYAPSAPLQDFRPFTRAKAVLSLWAGVERIVGNPTLTQVLCRMVDPALTEGMVDWCVAHTMRHHLSIDRHIVNPDRVWAPFTPPLSRERRVTVMGLGVLGSAVATALAGLGFDVAGWSARPKTIAGVTSLAGADGLEAALHRAEILILLLPRTPETEDFLNADRLALLPRGAIILNPGRGALVVDADLLAALDAGQVGHATLDVFRTEPLPPEHPFWAHPGVTVTPHMAADTRAASAARVIAENVRRGEAGAPFLHQVDRSRGY